ncbi:tRNA1(Val) (adenine(37)-N6)-methyltransferase [Mangrovibacterium lignilyticum]|uniref:tRNA1(Val) (adenine(37)-N6)-methyltransferase n=1 Tax=Mangrovibacterium lignilyticum TaxID=2668052 RepID=UPI0013D1958D|nr:methyltransferase [Mangrovibacterium lignilyticum]
MAGNNFFQFKHFKIIQEKAAMKVGIDGVLLGAWADFDGELRILDIGTGTGLLALMAAQRTAAFVDAVEVEPEAAEEARLNFTNSPWADKITVHGLAFQEFEVDYKYDHIISNPPFFETTVKSGDEKRAKARHADSLKLKDLLEKSIELLTDDGRISLILPAEKESRLRELALGSKLFVTRCARVFSDETKQSHRILVELSFNQKVDYIESIYLRKSDTGVYTDQYRTLTRDYYLSF